MTARLPLVAVPTDKSTIGRLSDPGDVVALLQELLAGQREILAAVAPDLAQRAAVLAALRSEFGDASFAAIDALEACAAFPEGPMARALVPWLGGPVGGLRRLSRRLAKLAGKPAGGLTLTRVGDDRGSALYVIRAG